MTESRTMTCTTCTEKFDNISSLLHHMASHSSTTLSNITLNNHGSTGKGATDRTQNQHSRKARQILLSRSAFLRLQPYLKQKNAPGVQVVVSSVAPSAASKSSATEAIKSTVAESGEEDEGDEENPSCQICHRSFKHRSSLVAHCKQHVMARTCGVCRLRAATCDDLLKHLKTHMSRDSTFKCNQCNKTFVHAKSLYVHKRNHTGAKPYVCEYCNKAFRHWHKRKVHERIHTGEKPYVCTICGWGFARNDERKRHMRSHDGSKAFHCVDCGVGCATRASLVLHQKLHHSENNLRGGGNTNPQKEASEEHQNCRADFACLEQVKKERVEVCDENGYDEIGRDNNFTTKLDVAEKGSNEIPTGCSPNFSDVHIKTEPTEIGSDLEEEIEPDSLEMAPYSGMCAYVVDRSTDGCHNNDNIVHTRLLEPKVDLTELVVDIEKMRATIRTKMANHAGRLEEKLRKEASVFVRSREPDIERMCLILKQKLEEGKELSQRLDSYISGGSENSILKQALIKVEPNNFEIIYGSESDL